ncbi:MAG: cobyric acid synthase [Proteobacteria bacterium]|nr:cobyric acid synthase [Pseudomonadota bacterium]
MRVAALMIQGCGSDVGKSVLVAGLCRLFTNRGITVRPFKSQNMSNNAAVTAGGGEIGRAQALQARACRTKPTVDMNPVLLKPQSDVGAQLIVRGRMSGNFDASAHGRDKRALLEVAVESYHRLAQEAQLVIVEGAGSPAETNLRKHDIANMGFAQAVGLPAILVGDINRGHVIASLVGAHAVLDAADRALIRGFIVNKFRGNPRLFDDGVQRVVEHTGWPSIGVVPWLRAAGRLPSEDGVQLEDINTRRASGARVKIVVPQLSRIANFDDFDPLRAEPEIELVFVPPGRPLPRDAALIVIPGTKSTIADMEFMRAQGWDVDVFSHVRHGGRVLGICGGYQMLGRSISDPSGIEGPPRTVPGLGLLDVETVMTGDKTLREVAGALVSAGAASFAGYEMHIGSTTGAGIERPFLQFTDGSIDGAVSADGRIAGCYVHGLFGETQARAALVSAIGAAPSQDDHNARVDAALDEIAAELEGCLDISALTAIAGLRA